MSDVCVRVTHAEAGRAAQVVDAEQIATVAARALGGDLLKPTVEREPLLLERHRDAADAGAADAAADAEPLPHGTVVRDSRQRDAVGSAGAERAVGAARRAGGVGGVEPPVVARVGAEPVRAAPRRPGPLPASPGLGVRSP